MIPNFRAWNAETKAMYEVKSLVFTLRSMFCVNRKLVYPERTFYFDDENIRSMQSTELKDKNDVEIFENDIVRFGHVFEGFLNQVVWDKQSCAFKLKSLDNRWDDTYFSNFGEETIESLEIIGNIYELESVEE